MGNGQWADSTRLINRAKDNNYQLSIINYQLSIINYQLSIINYQLSIIQAALCP